MMDAFKYFFNLVEQEKRDLFAAAAKRINVLPSYVEKDFWVCFILNLLYNELPADHPKLFFKGGTSLSKAFNLIQRFSEDIDIVVSRDDLDFKGEHNPMIGDLSKTRRKLLFGKLKTACSDYILKDLKVEIEKLINELVAGCSVYSDEQDADKQTLLIKYPTLYSDEGVDYVLPQVKIEGGARSGLEPTRICKIEPDIANGLDDWAFSVDNILTIAPERTYWEKLLILHGEYHRYQDGRIALIAGGNRLSRHYYDVAMITNTEIGRAALSDHALLGSVRNHNLIAFPQKSKKWKEAVPGKLRLVPQPALRKIIEEDYAAMEGMILGEAPKFEWVMQQIEFAETEINR